MSIDREVISKSNNVYFTLQFVILNDVIKSVNNLSISTKIYRYESNLVFITITINLRKIIKQFSYNKN